PHLVEVDEGIEVLEGDSGEGPVHGEALSLETAWGGGGASYLPFGGRGRVGRRNPGKGEDIGDSHRWHGPSLGPPLRSCRSGQRRRSLRGTQSHSSREMASLISSRVCSSQRGPEGVEAQAALSHRSHSGSFTAVCSKTLSAVMVSGSENCL